MNIEYWVFFGIVVSIFATTFDMPLTLSKLFYTTSLGVIGATVGGIVAYFLYGLQINGIDMSALFITSTGSAVLLIVGKHIEATYKILKGGEKHAGWSI